MKKEEKLFKEYMEKNLSVEDHYADIVRRIDFNKKEEHMKKKNLFYILGGGALTAALTLTVILFIHGAPQPTEKAAHALVNVDVNPSVSLVIDEDEKVLSVSGNNDDGKLVISGEAIVGKSLEDALKVIIEIETETGYLVSGNAEIDENHIAVSVSADGEKIARDLKEKVTSAIGNICEEFNVDETIEAAEQYTRQQLETLASKCDPTLSEEEIRSMSYQQLLTVISLYQLETAELYSEKLEDLYNQVKDYKLQFTEKEATQKAIEDVNAIYQILLQSYASMCDQLEETCNSIEETRYALLVDPESSYQKSLAEVKNAKEEVIRLKNEIAAIETEDPSISALKAQLTIKEEMLENALNLLSSAEESIDATLNSVQNNLQTILASLRDLENSFPSEIKTSIENKIKDTEKAVNQAKDEFFDSFEEKYAEDIARFKSEVIQRKQSMKEAIKA